MTIHAARKSWSRFWMRWAGLGTFGRLSSWLATWRVPPYYRRVYLAAMNPRGYVSPRAVVHHPDLHLARGVFLDDRVLIYQDKDGGDVELSKNVQIYRDTVIQTGAGGAVTIGARTTIQPRCQFSAYKGSIVISEDVQIAPNCSFYSYDHSFAHGRLIKNQPLRTKGGISIGADVWLGVGAIVLDGVHIGKGAVVGAGSIVTRDIPDGAIAFGSPARTVRMRQELSLTQVEP